MIVSLCQTLALSPSPQQVIVKINKPLPPPSHLHQALPLRFLQELETCVLARTDDETAAKMPKEGWDLTVLDGDCEGKTYYLVEVANPEDIAALAHLGNCWQVEEQVVLFQADEPGIREVIPARFHIKKLPDLAVIDSTSRTGTKQSLKKDEFRQRFSQNISLITEMVSQVSKNNLAGYIQNLQDFQTRYSSTSSCEAAGTYLFHFFANMGLDTSYDPFTFSHSQSSRNIIAVQAGRVNPQQQVIICGHYDSISRSAPSTLAPGADDNASGCAAVMEAAQILSQYAFDFSIRYICFSAEEWGLFGSEHYAQQAYNRNESIVAVLNLDMIAYADFLPEDLQIICNSSSEWLANHFASSTDLYVPLQVEKVINASVIYSDHSPFWDKGYSALLGIEEFPLKNPYYHTIHDTLPTLTMDFATTATKAAVATLADLAQPVSSPTSPTGLTARSQINHSLFQSFKTVLLNWDVHDETLNGYNIYRTTTTHDGYNKINPSLLTQPTYSDRGLDPETRFFYVVTAVDTQNRESNFSFEVRDDQSNQ